MDGPRRPFGRIRKHWGIKVMKRWYASCAAIFFVFAVASAQEGQPLTDQTPAAVAAGPVVQIVTTLGTVTLTLDGEHAPITVKNFLRYARQGHFNGTAIYRVVPGFVVQMGSIDAQGKGRPVHKPIPLETAAGLKNIRGAVAMARGEETASAEAEFFIDLADNTPLDPKPTDAPNTAGYAVFAQVTAGMEVVDAIAAVPLGGGYGPFGDAAPKTPIVVRKVVVVGDKPAAKR
jgi:cyclophilin family peptidyl-prolyl cis-trans isomerase